MNGMTELKLPNCTVCILPRVTWSWDDFGQFAPAKSIALDGMVTGGPRISGGLRLNFDHHDGVVREATMSTAMQVFFAIKGGMMTPFEHPHVFINDIDQDTSLAIWLLNKHALFEKTGSVPVIQRLLTLTDRWDITGGAFPVNLDEDIIREHAWVFEPYSDLRKSGQLAQADGRTMRNTLYAVLSRLDDVLMGRGSRLELDTRHEILGRAGPAGLVWAVRELGGNDARYALYQAGMQAFLAVVAERPDGRTVYSVGRRSRFVACPIPHILAALSAADDAAWGGSDIIGGSHRERGSSLTWQQALAVIGATLHTAATESTCSLS